MNRNIDDHTAIDQLLLSLYHTRIQLQQARVSCSHICAIVNHMTKDNQIEANRTVVTEGGQRKKQRFSRQRKVATPRPEIEPCCAKERVCVHHNRISEREFDEKGASDIKDQKQWYADQHQANWPLSGRSLEQAEKRRRWNDAGDDNVMHRAREKTSLMWQSQYQDDEDDEAREGKVLKGKRGKGKSEAGNQERGSGRSHLSAGSEKESLARDAKDQKQVQAGESASHNGSYLEQIARVDSMPSINKSSQTELPESRNESALAREPPQEQESASHHQPFIRKPVHPVSPSKESSINLQSVTYSSLEMNLVEGTTSRPVVTPEKRENRSKNNYWVQCTRCERWRMFSPNSTVVTSALPIKWYCYMMNEYDQSLKLDCSVQEKDEKWYFKYFTKRKTTKLTTNKTNKIPRKINKKSKHEPPRTRISGFPSCTGPSVKSTEKTQIKVTSKKTQQQGKAGRKLINPDAFVPLFMSPPAGDERFNAFLCSLRALFARSTFLKSDTYSADFDNPPVPAHNHEVAQFFYDHENITQELKPLTNAKFTLYTNQANVKSLTKQQVEVMSNYFKNNALFNSRFPDFDFDMLQMAVHKQDDSFIPWASAYREHIDKNHFNTGTLFVPTEGGSFVFIGTRTRIADDHSEKFDAWIADLPEKQQKKIIQFRKKVETYAKSKYQRFLAVYWLDPGSWLGFRADLNVHATLTPSPSTLKEPTFSPPRHGVCRTLAIAHKLYDPNRPTRTKQGTVLQTHLCTSS